MKDIQSYESFVKVLPFNKGWSKDKKYYVETKSNNRMLLRISNITEFSRKKIEFEKIHLVAKQNIKMSQPLEFGICNEGASVYMLLTWCDGEDARDVLPRLSCDEQLQLGIRSGEMLRCIHSLTAPLEQEDWATRFTRKTNDKIEKYRSCGIRIDGEEEILEYIETHRHLLQGRPQSFQHGDFHVGNMVISGSRELSIIDFNRWDFGDPWEEFNRIVWTAQVSPAFATGQLDGYFDGPPPEDFFLLFKFYIFVNMLSSISWAIPFGNDEVQVMITQAREVLEWFDNSKDSIPSWYKKKKKF